MQDLTSLTLEVREYARWFSQSSVKQRMHVGHISDAPALTPAATELIQQWSAQKPLSQQRLDELIATLEGFKATAPSMTITLAAPAPGDLKQTLVGWCRQNISPDTLVTFKFNATILGGMVVHYGSHVFDWSFRRQILAARAKFPEILRRV
jgi:hypothetical protein